MTRKERKILTCIDGSSVGNAVCDYASWMSKKMNRPVKLLHTIEHKANAAVSDLTGAIGLGSRKELLDELANREQEQGRRLIEAGQAILRRAGERITASGLENPEQIQMHGTLPESLTDLESEIGVLVVGIRGDSEDRRQEGAREDLPDRRQRQNHDETLNRRLVGIGKQLESIIRSIHRPILVVNTEFTEPRKAMLCYDGSDSSLYALKLIASNPAFKDIPCHVVHVGNKGEKLLEDAERTLTEVGVAVTTRQLSGNIVTALSDYQEENEIDVTPDGSF